MADNNTSIINQLRKYQITSYFKNSNELEKWLTDLTPLERKNFNNLDLPVEEIEFPKELLINKQLLSCSDYKKRITAMSKLKNGDGCWHLFNRLCSSNFLNCKYYYQDLALISTAPSARYALWIIDNDNFINSKYHTEDLIMIIESQNPELNNDSLVTESLAEIASNKDSINSIYHRQDMDIISKSKGYGLQFLGSLPKNSLNNLAIDPISLQDPYHIENMNILASTPIASEFLYQLMTNKNIVSGKYYREEIAALMESKSIINAIAIFYYITNPKDYSCLEFTGFNYYDLDLSDDSHQAIDFCYRYLGRKNNQPGKLTPEYLNNLKILSELDDKIVPYFESIISNKILINSPYYNQDIQLLQEVSDNEIYKILHQLMTNELSINSPHHFKDAVLISKCDNEKIRKLLLNKATNKESLESINHEYDMNYIAKLNLSKLTPHIYDRMFYYLFNPQGINSIDHVNILEKLLKGEITDSMDIYDDYISSLEENIIGFPNDEELTQQKYPKEKILTKIKKIFKSSKGL